LSLPKGKTAADVGNPQAYVDAALAAPKPDAIDIKNVPRRGNTLAEIDTEAERKKHYFDTTTDAVKKTNEARIKDAENTKITAEMANKVKPQLDELQAITQNPLMQFGEGAMNSVAAKKKAIAYDAAVGETYLDPKVRAEYKESARLYEQFNKVVNGLSLQSLRTLLPPNPGQIRNMEIKIIQEALPQALLTRGGTEKITTLLQRLNDRAIIENKMMMEFTEKNGGIPDQRITKAIADFQDNNPILNDKEIAELSTPGASSTPTSKLPEGPPFNPRDLLPRILGGRSRSQEAPAPQAPALQQPPEMRLPFGSGPVQGSAPTPPTEYEITPRKKRS
jgi:hypothetical protein